MLPNEGLGGPRGVGLTDFPGKYARLKIASISISNVETDVKLFPAPAKKDSFFRLSTNLLNGIISDTSSIKAL